MLVVLLSKNAVKCRINNSPIEACIHEYLVVLYYCSFLPILKKERRSDINTILIKYRTLWQKFVLS